MDRIGEYLNYHASSSKMKDIDIQVEGLLSIANLRSLSLDESLWLGFLFATCYCVPTAWSMFCGIGAFESITPSSIYLYWKENKHNLLFQTDRAWNKRSDLLPEIVISFKRICQRLGGGSISKTLLNALKSTTTPNRFDALVNLKIKSFGRFSWFLYSELVHHTFRAYGITHVPIVPILRLKDAESVKNGVVFAMGIEESAYTGRGGRASTEEELATLHAGLRNIIKKVSAQDITERHKSIWSIETTLCAYKKFNLGKRYVGYYAERFIKELKKMMELDVYTDWSPIVDFAKDNYPHLFKRFD